MPIPNEHMLDHCVLGADHQPLIISYIMTKKEVEALLLNNDVKIDDPKTVDLKIFTDKIEEKALAQVNNLLAQPAFSDCKVRMRDWFYCQPWR